MLEVPGEAWMAEEAKSAAVEWAPEVLVLPRPARPRSATPAVSTLLWRPKQ